MTGIQMARRVKGGFAERGGDDAGELPGDRAAGGQDDCLVRGVARAGIDLARRRGEHVVGADRQAGDAHVIGKVESELRNCRHGIERGYGGGRTGELNRAAKNLGVTEHHGAAAVVNAVVSPGADDDLGPDAGGIAESDGQEWFFGNCGHDFRSNRVGQGDSSCD